MQSQIVAGLKIPIRQAPPPAAASSVTSSAPAKKQEEEWEVFISHASEDKEAIATPLAEALQANGLRVWYDDFSLRLGDSLRQSIDRGLARSRFGVVILSARFFEKHWPQQELNGLATREVNGEKVVLPVWHGVGFSKVRNYSPMLADRIAVQTKDGLALVVQRIVGSGRQSRCSVAEVNRHAYHPASGCDDGKHKVRNASASNGARNVRKSNPCALRSLNTSGGTGSFHNTICVSGETTNKLIPACAPSMPGSAIYPMRATSGLNVAALRIASAPNGSTASSQSQRLTRSSGCKRLIEGSSSAKEDFILFRYNL